MKVSNREFWKFAVMAGVAMTAVLYAAIIRMEAAPPKSAQAETNRAAADDGYIGGIVTSAKGPEAGVWVIAETTDLGTKFRKIVVTNDRGPIPAARSSESELQSLGARLWPGGFRAGGRRARKNAGTESGGRAHAAGRGRVLSRRLLGLAADDPAQERLSR